MFTYFILIIIDIVYVGNVELKIRVKNVYCFQFYIYVSTQFINIYFNIYIHIYIYKVK